MEIIFLLIGVVVVFGLGIFVGMKIAYYKALDKLEKGGDTNDTE